MVKCPECGEIIDLPEDCEEGEVFECQTCGVEVQVIQVFPQVEISLIEEEEK